MNKYEVRLVNILGPVARSPVGSVKFTLHTHLPC